MRADDKRFIDAYLKWLRENSSQKVINGYTEITTPFLDSNNDCIQYYIKEMEDGCILTDDGYTLNDLLMQGCDIKSKNRKELIEQIGASLGVTISGEEITVKTTVYDIAPKQHILIQAILRISDMFMTTSSRVRGLFFEEVAEYLDKHDVRSAKSIMLTGQSGLMHNFDFIIPASKSMPERLITTLNTPSKQTVQAALFSLEDIKRVRKEEHKGFIILNDTKKIKDEIVMAIKACDATPIQWKQRDEYIDKLIA